MCHFLWTLSTNSEPWKPLGASAFCLPSSNMVLLRLPLPPEVKYVSVVYIVFCGEEKESVIWVQRIFFFLFLFYRGLLYRMHYGWTHNLCTLPKQLYSGTIFVVQIIQGCSTRIFSVPMRLLYQ